ncbi:MAG: hypothetical protein V4621_05990 [Pseudomonadota bacterium]
MDFQTTLLREKFIISDADSTPTKSHALIAASNRIVLSLPGLDVNAAPETYVVRTNTMHSCVRLSAKVMQTYEMDGPLTSRAHLYDWKTSWAGVQQEYDKLHAAHSWAVIYRDGEILFTTGGHNPFLDVVESCDIKNKGRYEQSLKMAESAFARLGKSVKIEYDGGVALVVNLQGHSCRCGVIIRAPERKTSFNFLVDTKDGMDMSVAQTLTMAANYLEGIELSYRIGAITERMSKSTITATSIEEKEAETALRRIGKLNNAIKVFEQTHQVRYRPEPPSFDALIKQAQAYTSTRT